MIFHRTSTTPLLTRQDVPDLPPDLVDVSSIFNPGAVLVDGQTILLCRVQTRGRRTFTWPAVKDGIGFRFTPHPVEFLGLDELPLTIHHNYDARITACEGQLYVITALDTDLGCRLAVWQAAGPPDDGCAGLSRLRLLSLTGQHDTRNGVLFPRRIGGRYALLERPNTTQTAGGPASGNGVRLLSSENLLTWSDEGAVFDGHPHYWDELVGSGPPPIETEAGWLHIYHGVATHFQSANIYQGGAVLLDRDDPTQVLGRTRDNILEPRLAWEVSGQVPNVVFPTGLTIAGNPKIAESSAGLNLYYGAADTVIGHTTSTVGELLAACR